MPENFTNTFLQPSTDNTTNNETDVYALSNTVAHTFATPFFFVIVNYVVSFLGFLLNTFTVIIICLYKPMHKHYANILIINQSVVDAIAAIILLFWTLYPPDSIPRTPGNPANEVLCRIWFSSAAMYAILISSTYGIVAITFERFLAVVFPLWHKAKLSNRKIVIVIIIVCMIGPIYFFPLASMTSKITSHGICVTIAYFGSIKAERGASIFSFVLKFIIPLGCHFLLYWLMLRALRAKTFLVAVEVPPVLCVEETQNRALNVSIITGEYGKERKDRSISTATETPRGVEIYLNESTNGSKTPIFPQKAVFSENTEIGLVAFRTNGASTGQSSKTNETNWKSKTGIVLTTQFDVGLKAKLETKRDDQIVQKKMNSTSRARRNLIKTIITVGVCNVLLWSVNQIGILMHHFGNDQIYNNQNVFDFSIALVFLSCCINPIIYALQYRHFQKAIKVVLGRGKKYFNNWKKTGFW